MNMSPDEPLWQWEFLILNRTILFTWLVMGLLTCGSWFITRRLSTSAHLSRGQNLLEVLVSGLRNQIQEVSQQDPGPYLPFIGTLFLFIVVSNILSIVPGYHAPTSSISTTAALATCVFVAVPLYGIASQGLVDYLKQYIRPSVLMLPFNIIGELSRTLALAVRLYGNIMSGSVIGAILLGFVPLFVPILMQAFGLLTGIIQAYIFSVLAMVYIASATQVSQAISEQPQSPEEYSKQKK
ncbi:F0F1 ATP synthase subunit A [Gimesia maris]|jgi:F-type H+-transporting ATPase subunit a|uniref:ATP synthase subunit a n=1 Tax=Gimesia maris TaxID=122 RepID=A0A3D3RCC0_9PLAN|nr:F0F1 ATP synthase subunit A [Gimesia maris]MAC56424.1 F0F1 ATP synthase subunit A [Gimesia sp.]EDL61108.1 ATP synthase subunit A [Gimesia maris DSM 8797]QDT78462.1 ATP synthase subunit a [Gimesia maris]QEG16027.1 ATP synthase subunit a [Gimesia maris]QGQ30719.1 F0F1 ATP synthase subunit A [Gimesia maris]|tara:strand:+ start:16319 stop:17035 length:717 start_codon:yes stop_codon:yes gene_type:complete